jgi:hypothetical protein
MSVMDPGLREELLAMAAADQDARQRLDCHPRPSQGMSEQELTAAEQIRAVDAANTARMQAIVHAYGWPGRTLVVSIQVRSKASGGQRSSPVTNRPTGWSRRTMTLWP